MELWLAAFLGLAWCILMLCLCALMDTRLRVTRVERRVEMLFGQKAYGDRAREAARDILHDERVQA